MPTDLIIVKRERFWFYLHWDTLWAIINHDNLVFDLASRFLEDFLAKLVLFCQIKELIVLGKDSTSDPFEIGLFLVALRK